MKRILFALLAALLGGLFVWLFLNRQNLSNSGGTRQQPRTVIPASPDITQTKEDPSVSTGSIDESRVQPLIPLAPDETFLQGLSADLNRDGLADQICAVKNVTDSAIYLLPGIQTPITGEYIRGTAIKTGVTQSRTLLFYIMDIIGDHTEALICSGMTAENQQLLSVYLPEQAAEGKISYRAVADLRADGPISIRVTERYEAYNLGLTAGESYPIVSYSSDPDAPQTLDQIERTYTWDKALKRYRETAETKITGKKIESNLLRQLQGGDSETFKRFLTGLWHQGAQGSAESPRYLFYDPIANEFIFHSGATEEVYQIDTIVNRRYGVYLTTRNKSISNIRRLIDIELSAADEIRIKVQEDVQLKIGVASDWDGLYRKTAGSQPAGPAVSLASVKDRIVSAAVWASGDGTRISFAQSGYSMTGSGAEESGIWALFEAFNGPVLQLRPKGGQSRFYLVSLPKDGLEIKPVTLTMQGTGTTGEPTITLTPDK